MRLPPLAIAAAALVLLAAAPARAATWTVTKPADTADGACDDDCSVREAVLAANAAPGADTVTVPAGTYTLTIAGRHEDGGATGDLDLVGPGGHGTTITGAGEGATFLQAGGSRAQGIDRVLHVAAANAVVQDLTLRHGRLQSGTQENGGAVRVDQFGGLEMRRAAVRDSDAGTGSLHGGGGISALGTLQLTDVTVDGNLAGGLGGGGILFASESERTAHLLRVTVSRNVASDANVSGGGILSQGRHQLTITNTTVSGNELTPGSTGSGGGRGAGISILGIGAATLRFVTIADNRGAAPGPGTGGLWGSSADTSTIGASVLAGNSHNGVESNCTQSTRVASAGGNVEDGATCAWLFTQATDRTDAEPGLGPLQDNGGATETHGLTPASDAIDHAGPTCAFAPTDQRGAVRPQGAGCDAGAYEVGPVLEPDLAVSLTDAPDPVALGEEITYTARIVNIGGTDAHGAVLTWTLPSGDEVVTDLGTVRSGAAALLSTHRFTPRSTGTKTASVAVAAAGDPEPGNDGASTDTRVTSVPVPSNTLAPSISPGSPMVGTPLTCAPGTWTNDPQELRYSWLRGDVEVGTGPGYTPVLGDARAQLVCRVVAVNAGGDGLPADSAPVTVAPPPVPVNTAAPSISPGAAQVGTVLTCAPGTWTNSPDRHDITWRRGDADVGSGARHTVLNADAGGRLSCRVVAINDGGESAPADSAGVDVPALPPPPAHGQGPDLAIGVDVTQRDLGSFLLQDATITVTNVGTSGSGPATATLRLPAGVSASGAGAQGCSGGSSSVRCPVRQVGPGVVALSATFRLYTDATGAYTFTARSESSTDLFAANDVAVADVNLGANPFPVEIPDRPGPDPSDFPGSWWDDGEGSVGTLLSPAAAEPGTELSCTAPSTFLREYEISFSWKRGGITIAGETGASYAVTREDTFEAISCVALGTFNVRTSPFQTTLATAGVESRAVRPLPASRPAIALDGSPVQTTPSGDAPVDAYCPQSTGGCAGGALTITLGTPRPVALTPPTAVASASRRADPARLGSRRFSIRRGRNKRVSVKLTPFARRLLRVARSVPVKVSVTYRVKRSGKRRKASVKTALRAPAGRR